MSHLQVVVGYLRVKVINFIRRWQDDHNTTSRFLVDTIALATLVGYLGPKIINFIRRWQDNHTITSPLLIIFACNKIPA